MIQVRLNLPTSMDLKSDVCLALLNTQMQLNCV